MKEIRFAHPQFAASTDNTGDELDDRIEMLREVPKIRAALRLLLAKVGELPGGEALRAEVEALVAKVGVGR